MLFFNLHRLPDGLVLTQLRTVHAELIRDHWKHYREKDGLVEYYRQVIDHFDNSAIFTHGGDLVAYICMQFNGSMANLFVDPAYRGRNLGAILLQDLTRKLVEKNHIAFGFIKTRDSDFITTCQAMGFEWVPQGSMSWVHHQPSTCAQAQGQKLKSSTVSSFLSWSTQDNKNKGGNNSCCEAKNLFLNALPLSCNECSGIPIGPS